VFFTVYLAGPIQNVNFEAAVGWRNIVKEKLLKLGVRVLDPMRGKMLPYNYTDREIAERDFDDLDQSNAVILYCKQNVVMEGSSCEVGFCRAKGIPVISVGKANTALVRDTVSKYGKEVNSLKEAVEIIKRWVDNY
jgi:nucleoside 2-deoxyribosyltransferase